MRAPFTTEDLLAPCRLEFGRQPAHVTSNTRLARSSNFPRSTLSSDVVSELFRSPANTSPGTDSSNFSERRDPRAPSKATGGTFCPSCLREFSEFPDGTRPTSVISRRQVSPCSGRVPHLRSRIRHL